MQKRKKEKTESDGLEQVTYSFSVLFIFCKVLISCFNFLVIFGGMLKISKVVW